MHESTIDDLDRRHFTRIGGQYSDRQHVLLRIRGKDVAAELLDQSLDGFSVRLPRGKARLSIGKRLLLGIRSTWHEVSVVNLTKEKKQLRVGLQLVADCVAPKERGVWIWIGLSVTLALATAMIYQNENPRTGGLHRCLQRLRIERTP